MAWNKTVPSNSGLLINFPSQARANWDALELGTDSALQITNAKVANLAAIADYKLAQITTASKVSGAALTLLANIPFGAGDIPSVNLDGNGVVLTGDQTVAGVKTFSSIPVLPASDPTTENQVSRKAYTDGKISKTSVGEINAMTEKTSLADADILLIEDSAANYAKKKVQKSNLVGGIWADYSTQSTVVGWTSFTTKQIYTKKINKTVFVAFDIRGTSNATTATFTLPYTSAMSILRACAFTTDNNINTTTGGLIDLATGASLVNLFKDMAGAAWTALGSKFAVGQFWYESA